MVIDRRLLCEKRALAVVVPEEAATSRKAENLNGGLIYQFPDVNYYSHQEPIYFYSNIETP
jgi:hypothetical protein